MQGVVVSLNIIVVIPYQVKIDRGRAISEAHSSFVLRQ